MPKVEILEVSYYCPGCDMRQDVEPGPHMKSCPEYTGLMDTRVEGTAVYLTRSKRFSMRSTASTKKAIVEVERKQRGPLSTPAWLERETRSM